MADTARHTFLAGILLVVAGCAGVSHGLQSSGDPGAVCVPADTSDLATISLDWFENVTDQDITVTAAGLTDAQGLEMADWYLIPEGPPPGVLSGYTRPADGGTTVPAGTKAVLVLGLRLTSQDGRATRAEVTYTIGSARRVTVNGVIAHRVVPAGTRDCFDGTFG